MKQPIRPIAWPRARLGAIESRTAQTGIPARQEAIAIVAIAAMTPTSRTPAARSVPSSAPRLER